MNLSCLFISVREALTFVCYAVCIHLGFVIDLGYFGFVCRYFLLIFGDKLILLCACLILLLSRVLCFCHYVYDIIIIKI